MQTSEGAVLILHLGWEAAAALRGWAPSSGTSSSCQQEAQVWCQGLPGSTQHLWPLPGLLAGLRA